ncbi:hypothetical protein FXB39_14410 [Nocardioides sp. BGMRC 2183]|nr:hypothetical protein FXB39_14410 [Nocardioides sp. BGMRC 2183]
MRPDRRVARVAAAVLVAYLAFVGARLAVFEGDPSAFIAAGDQITDVAATPTPLVVTDGVSGYDGQAYYRLALSPWTDRIHDHGIGFTRPAYWQTRVGYPASVWMLTAGGRVALVPTAMLAVNLLAVLAITVLAAAAARDLGRSPWWGAVPALWAGFLVGVGQDLTEPLAGALLLAALLALRRERYLVASLTLVAAALTRETTLVVAAAVVLAAGATAAVVRIGGPAREPAPPWWVGAVPLLVYAGWRALVQARWAGVVPDPPGDNVLRLPGEALAGYLSSAAERPEPEWANLVLLAPALVAFALLGTAVVRRDGLLHERIALAGYLALLVCLPVWDRGQAYLRWGCEPLLLGWLLLLGHRWPAGARDHATPAATSRLGALSVLSVVLWMVTATQSVGYPLTDGPGAGWWAWS